MVLRMDNGPELISEALQSFCAGKVGLHYIPPGTPWNNAYIESFNNRLRRERLNRKPTWTEPARSPRRHRRLQARTQRTTSPLSAGLSDPGRVRCPMQPHPSPRGLRDQLNRHQTQPGSRTGWNRISGTCHCAAAPKDPGLTDTKDDMGGSDHLAERPTFCRDSDY